MKLTKQHIIELFAQIGSNVICDYVNPGEYTVKIKSVDTDIHFSLYKNDVDQNRDVPLTETAMETMAEKIKENQPISIDAALVNGGNKRSAIEGAIIRTSEFYSIKNGRNKNIVWVLSMPHPVGEKGIWPEDKELPQPTFENAKYILEVPYIKGDIQYNSKEELAIALAKRFDEIYKNGDRDKVSKFFLFALKYYDYIKVFSTNKEIIELLAKHSTEIKSSMEFHGFGEMLSFIDFMKKYKEVSDVKFYLTDVLPKRVMSNESSLLKEKYTNDLYRPYITAIKSKPFLLLAGISGTGKSRIVRELARACWPIESEEYKAQKPKNFEMVQVKPNWHDSSELIGYVSRISGEPIYVVGDFLKFIAKAWENWLSDDKKPYFLCLDEMNLAPVEQYFAEYLSVVESRKVAEDGGITYDPLVKKDADGFDSLLRTIAWKKQELNDMFESDGVCLPPNLIVVGTVNMDETTFSFSRKVLDRAMTIEMNEVDLRGGLTKRYEPIGQQSIETLVGTAVEGVDVYESNQAVCDLCIDYLDKVNAQLEGTPFKVAYRTRNEVLLYVVNNLPYTKEEDGTERSQEYVIARALDEITNMKILSRIEGDESKVTADFLGKLKNTISEALTAVSSLRYADKAKSGDEEGVEDIEKSISLAKLTEMTKKLDSGYTSFWS